MERDGITRLYRMKQKRPYSPSERNRENVALQVFPHVGNPFPLTRVGHPMGTPSGKDADEVYARRDASIIHTSTGWRHPSGKAFGISGHGIEIVPVDGEKLVISTNQLPRQRAEETEALVRLAEQHLGRTGLTLCSGESIKYTQHHETGEIISMEQRSWDGSTVTTDLQTVS